MGAWFDASYERLASDRALFYLADMLMKDWCSGFGGVPSDPVQLLQLRCSFEPQATKLLANLCGMSPEARMAVSVRVRPTAREVKKAPETASLLRTMANMTTPMDGLVNRDSMHTDMALAERSDDQICGDADALYILIEKARDILDRDAGGR